MGRVWGRDKRGKRFTPRKEDEEQRARRIGGRRLRLERAVCRTCLAYGPRADKAVLQGLKPSFLRLFFCWSSSSDPTATYEIAHRNKRVMLDRWTLQTEAQRYSCGTPVMLRSMTLEEECGS